MLDFNVLRSQYTPLPLTKLELYKLHTKNGVALNPIDTHTFLEHYEGCMLEIIRLRSYYLRSFIALIASMLINAIFVATLFGGI